MFMAALGAFLTHTRAQGAEHAFNPSRRACATVANYLRCAGPLQLHCYKVLDDECKKLHCAPDSPWKQLAKRIVQVNACTLNMSNHARSEGLEIRGYTMNEDTAELRAGVATTDEAAVPWQQQLGQLQEQRMVQLLRFNPKNEVAAAEAALAAWWSMAQLMPNPQLPIPDDPLSLEAREWAWATMMVLYKCLVTGGYARGQSAQCSSSQHNASMH